MRRVLKYALAGAAIGAVFGFGVQASNADPWSLAQAAAPYKGMTVTVVGLDRPSYKAAQELTPEFENETGIHVKWVNFPYEDTLKAETLNFVSHSNQFDAILTDVVWPVDFTRAKWVVPVEQFLSDEAIADPDVDLNDFIPVWRHAFTVGGKLIGLPFDSYAGLLYYNKKILSEHGFSGPPTTWQQLLTDYAPKLYDPAKNLYGYALQSARGETQTADSFTRFLWPWGGRYFDAAAKKMTLDSPQAIAGLTFRQDLVKYMPKGIIADDHSQVVQLMGQGQLAMITEWSAFYPTLKDSAIGDDLGVTVEPTGPDGRFSAFGGFAYMVSAQIPAAEQKATWLFIQWLTSKAMAKPLIEDGAVVARVSADTDPTLDAKYPYLKPMVETWENGSVPDWRPQIACYPYFSELVSDYGSDIETGQYPVAKGAQILNAKLQKYMDSSGCWNSINLPQH
ncbi:MAG TPA: sugar ABC transporter substrate-binding protein [Acetobacteraceae bacterium]|nr:sugar ABC transporter substrate-binding protein [Acetobacteraceae bacterium]